jgi:hypothetical protein
MIIWLGQFAALSSQTRAISSVHVTAASIIGSYNFIGFFKSN